MNDHQYITCVKTIMTRVKCSYDEAWDGLTQAFLTLDQSRPETAQCWWLINIGSFAVIDSVRKTYSSKEGVKREVPSDFLTTEAPTLDEYAFLKAFPEGFVREFAQRLADGQSKLTEGSCNHWLRKQHKLNNRRTAREIIRNVRIYSKRL